MLTREGDGWRLAPTALTFAGGNATVSGLFGGIDQRVQRPDESMPLGVLDIGWPQLGLGGIASGTLSYRFGAVGEPSGDANLRVRGLTRSGLVLSSRPVDIGLVAKLAGGNAGASRGRGQRGQDDRPGAGAAGADRPKRQYRRAARVAPLFAQLRYNGPADTLWRLTGVELLDVSRPGRGRRRRARHARQPADPRLAADRAGADRKRGHRNGDRERPGRAAGSAARRLVLDSFAGTTKSGGTVTGRAPSTSPAPKGFGIDIALQAKAAQLLDRDDIKAQVTGPLAHPLRRRGRQHLGQGRPGQRQLQARQRHRLGAGAAPRRARAQPPRRRAAGAAAAVALAARPRGRRAATG